MAMVKKIPGKTTPAATAAPKAGLKPPAPKPAATAAPKAGLKPAAAKPAAAAVKPAATAAAPKVAPKAAPAAAKPKEEPGLGIIKALEDRIAVLEKRVDQHELDLIGIGPWAVIQEDGDIKFDFEGAPRSALRTMAWLFGFKDLLGKETEAIRKALTKKRGAKDFEGFTFVNAGAAPAEEEVEEEPAEEEAAEEAEAEGEAEESVLSFGQDEINAANWKTLTQYATEAGVDFSDLKTPQAKVLRARLSEILATEEAGEAEADENGLIPGVTILQVGEDQGVFQRYSEDGLEAILVIVNEEGQEEEASAPLEECSVVEAEEE